VEYLTLYTFSTENWGRPAEEVDALMELFCQCVIHETPSMQKEGIRIRMIGDRSRFSAKVQEHLARAEELTAGCDRLTLILARAEDLSSGCDRLTLILALNYSSRDEIARAVRTLAGQVRKGELAPEQIDEQRIAATLDTASYPDPDLVVRTSGECRLSNFLLWQASYAELYFPPVLWPDFTEEEFDRAIEEYARRDRRFGLVK